jgi:son of sevenless-like protein
MDDNSPHVSLSLLVEPKQAADNPPNGDVRQLFNWATRSQSQPQAVTPS